MPRRAGLQRSTSGHVKQKQNKHNGELGQVEAVDESTLNILFEVATPSGGKILLPAGEDLVDDIDHKNRKIYMTLPDGLLALGE